MVMGFGGITELTNDQCWALLRSNDLGRIAVSAAGLVDIFPINYAVDEGARTVYFRTAPGTKLLELAINDRIALEIDGHDEHEAWSVVVKGSAERVERQSEMDAAERLGLEPWIPTLKYRWVRIRPLEIAGRRFALGPEPSRV
ncbi:pyridoxamine 5'-phosphate oxidase family protein [Microcella frigidaquae]|uniref:Nitroimidazol reductase NimA-like FMN-containing flavoprotein (Pyridoxamine 5'-phosphate oxidase superfamily) n=1 Tax=Microcella frigidaquae TaxID=424758 RepID=A0A840X3T5_9MICO|nr:pyridoxamine 5'-phosphate oxidase family protein [Microcella frigidaquae]MBB5617040.1 nitroimidazol reductase NimA-like FMN-containing flavoprotein (pyridoxamine 5'-phosphate oxidase superfamily) [Microcella frigidaquae]NHN45245.1 pyridoxamine 5'-phosphate oxidase family protein [Microcella frigidaquae]